MLTSNYGIITIVTNRSASGIACLGLAKRDWVRFEALRVLLRLDQHHTDDHDNLRDLISVRHNDFHKDWQRRVRVHFDQPGRKHRRREARLSKAAAVAPRPVDKLRPVVQCPTIKYNRRVRAGRGFTIQELKEAGIPRKLAPTIGISVDHRRKNVSQESLAANVARLQEYKSRLILFPRKSGQYKKLDASADDVAAAKKAFAAEGKVEGYATRASTVVPIKNAAVAQAVTEISRSDLPEGEKAAYRRLREARSEARYLGAREKRAKAKAEEAEAAKK
ncbi:60S ribosomal protein L13 [Talaromyces islandicus]|uniref:60S ribosomal protein L13 n=1 Tax=Talaromyces islandicus TaxID=28573 RepID=A0A0U1MBR4_TALIS|nr:60S ribosomal protein L13 [Talaromyces islandicus]